MASEELENCLTPDEAQMAFEVLANANAAPRASLLADLRQIMEMHQIYHSLLTKLRRLAAAENERKE